MFSLQLPLELNENSAAFCEVCKGSSISSVILIPRSQNIAYVVCVKHNIFSAFCKNTSEALKCQIRNKRQECLQTKVASGGGVYPQTGTYVRYSDTWDLPTWGRNNNKNKESRTQIILYNFLFPCVVVTSG